MFYEQIKVMGITFCLAIYLLLICSNFLSFIIFIIYPTLSKHKHTWGFCFGTHNSEYNKLHIQIQGNYRQKNWVSKELQKVSEVILEEREREDIQKLNRYQRWREEGARNLSYLTIDGNIMSLNDFGIHWCNQPFRRYWNKRKADRERIKI